MKIIHEIYRSSYFMNNLSSISLNTYHCFLMRRLLCVVLSIGKLSSTYVKKTKFPRGNLPCVSLKDFKMQHNDIGRAQVMWKYPTHSLMSFFGELKYLQVWGNFSLILIMILNVPLNFRVDSCFTYNPNFRMDSLHQQPQSPGIPCRIPEILPAGSQERSSAGESLFIWWIWCDCLAHYCSYF